MLRGLLGLAELCSSHSIRLFPILGKGLRKIVLLGGNTATGLKCVADKWLKLITNTLLQEEILRGFLWLIQACIHNAEEALASCKKIGFPIMLKASWGGGGKGIRKVCTILQNSVVGLANAIWAKRGWLLLQLFALAQVLNEDEVVNAFKQVQGEIPGSPIFAMKLAPPSRHLEVQLLADKHGQVCSVFSRDCSVQRRHQKIVEEGPVTKVHARHAIRREGELGANVLHAS